MKEETFAVHAVITDETLLEPTMNKVRCPECGYTFVKPLEPKEILSGDRWGGAGWAGRGWLAVVPIEGECGHLFEICFGFHKGETVIFGRPAQAPPDTGVKPAER